MISHTVGAVLAGGLSSRMGTDKAGLEYGDAPFIDHILATMSLAVAEVVVCGGSYNGPVPVVPDPVEQAGPLAGLLAALDYADGKPVVVVATDMPLVSVELIRRLADPQLTDARARLARSNDRVQPLCAAYGPGLRDIVVDALRGPNRSAMGLVETLHHIDYIESDTHTLTNINTPQDYEALMEALRQ